MDVHTSMVGVTADELKAAHQADLDIQRQGHRVDHDRAEPGVDHHRPWHPQ